MGSEAVTVVDTKTVVSWGVCTQSSKGRRSMLPVAYAFDLEAAAAAFLSRDGNCSRLFKVHHIPADQSFTVYGLAAMS